VRLHNWICEHSNAYHKHAHVNAGDHSQTNKNLSELLGVSVTCFDFDIDSISHPDRYSRKVLCSRLAFETSLADKENYVNSVGGCLAAVIGDCLHPIFLDKF